MPDERLESPEEGAILRTGDKWFEPVSFKATVIKEGSCRASHKEGELFEFDWRTPLGICSESFVGMYPVLHSLRVYGDMRELGSPERNVRIYNCPSRVIQFRIEATYHCNLCGQALPIEDEEIKSWRLGQGEGNLWVRVCETCFSEHRSKKLEWYTPKHHGLRTSLQPCRRHQFPLHPL